MKFCEECGAQLEDGALFCDECGAKQEAVENEETIAENVEAVELVENVKPSSEVVNNKSVTEKNKKPLFFIGGAFIGIIILIVVLVLIIRGGDKDSDKNSQDVSSSIEETEESEESTVVADSDYKHLNAFITWIYSYADPSDETDFKLSYIEWENGEWSGDFVISDNGNYVYVANNPVTFENYLSNSETIIYMEFLLTNYYEPWYINGYEKVNDFAFDFGDVNGDGVNELIVEYNWNQTIYTLESGVVQDTGLYFTERVSLRYNSYTIATGAINEWDCYLYYDEDYGVDWYAH